MDTTVYRIEKHVILFTDIHDYSIVAEALGMGHMLPFLQEFYETQGDIIVAHHGEIIKYLGDAILCIFPAGNEVETVRCAQKMRSAYADLVMRRSITHDTELEVGIDAGEVEIGIVGHASLRQNDIFGEHVSRAAVIGHHRGIAVTDDVHRVIAAHYDTAPLPDVRLKWRAEPLTVWEILA